MEKQYLISEEKLKQKLEHLQKAGFIIGVDKVMMDFILKSKTPVEVIASGEVKHDIVAHAYLIGDEILLPAEYTGGAVKEKIEELEGKLGTLIFVEDKEIK